VTDHGLASEGIADKELSELLARDQLIPVVDDTTYEALREVSPLLGSRSGLSTTEGCGELTGVALADLRYQKPCKPKVTRP